MKFIKYLLMTVFSLIFLVIIAAIAIPLLIDPNDYKLQIAQQVKQQTGRDLKIIGDIQVSLGFSPLYLPTSLAFELGKTELSNPEIFSTLTKNPFIKVNKIAVNASILPLIQDNKLEIGKIILEQANIFLLKNKQGQANWENLLVTKGPAADTENKSKKTAPPAAKQTTRPMPEIQLAGIEIKDSIVHFDDYSSGQHIHLNKLQLNVSELKENKPVNLNFTTDFTSSNLSLKGQFSIKTKAIINLKQQHYQLNKTTLELAVSGPSIPGKKSHTRLSGDIILDLSKQLLTINQLILDSYQLNLQGHIKVTDLITNPQFKSQLELAQFSPKELMKQLDIQLPKMKNSKVLNTAKMKLQIEGDSKQLKLSSLDVAVDDIIIKGNATIRNFKQPSYQLKLDINKLHLDDYAVIVDNQKQPVNKEDKVNKAAKPANTQQQIIPVELLKSLNVNGQLKIGELTSNGIKMSHIILTVKGKNGLVTLDPVQSDFYKGKLQLKTIIDVRKKIPKITLKQNFSQIDLGQLLLDVTGTKEFTGTANISSQLTTKGNFQQQLIKNSNGTGKFLITDGHIAKLDILHSLRQAHSLFYGKPMPTQQQQSNTQFSELKGSVKIKNGVIHNQDLFSKSPVMQLTGAGYADLPKQYLDYTLKVMLLNSLQIDKNTDATDYRGKEIPYTIKGKFSELSKQADVKDILKKQVKAEAKKQLSKQLDKQLEGEKGDKIKEQIGEENLNKLKGLFKF
ncbi:MAG: AsmA family protein [Pseudomonadota bacterium]